MQKLLYSSCTALVFCFDLNSTISSMGEKRGKNISFFLELKGLRAYNVFNNET